MLLDRSTWRERDLFQSLTSLQMEIYQLQASFIIIIISDPFPVWVVHNSDHIQFGGTSEWRVLWCQPLIFIHSICWSPLAGLYTYNKYGMGNAPIILGWGCPLFRDSTVLWEFCSQLIILWKLTNSWKIFVFKYTYSEDNMNLAHYPDDANPSFYIQTQEEFLDITDNEVSIEMSMYINSC